MGVGKTRVLKTFPAFGKSNWTCGFALVVLLLSGAFTRAAEAQDSVGAKAFKTKCVACHGPDGTGSTPIGKALKVANLQSPDVQKKSDAELAQFIADGKG